MISQETLSIALVSLPLPLLYLGQRTRNPEGTQTEEWSRSYRFHLVLPRPPSLKKVHQCAISAGKKFSAVKNLRFCADFFLVSNMASLPTRRRPLCSFLYDWIFAYIVPKLSHKSAAMAHVKQQKAHTRQSAKNSVSPPGNLPSSYFSSWSTRLFQTNEQILPFFRMNGKFPVAEALKLWNARRWGRK